MNIERENALLRKAAPIILAAAFLAAGGSFLGAQDAPAPAPDASASENDMFGQPETVAPAAQSSAEAEGKSEFLKYDQVKVGGSLTGKLGFNSIWSPAWDGSAQLFDPESRYLSPDLEGKVTLVAKPSTDFGVNMDFRTSWPFSSTATYKDPNTGLTSSSTIPNITVWSLYSKFNWQDKVYFSFGKQPLSWGVSKGYFQPADDIFAVSAAIDPTNTGAEREGPVSLKVTVPMSVTNNLYFFAGLPTDTNGGTQVNPADARLAVKGEFSFGNTEAALAGFYAYNDHPRVLAMATTGIGSWNFYGEGVLKYGSERYFIQKDAALLPLGLIGDQESGKLYFSGTAGGYYMDSDNNLTIALAYMYNGEAQSGVSYEDAVKYYGSNPTQLDRAKFGSHYAFASISKGNILHDSLGSDKLSASLIAISDLSDLSGYLMPSLTWTFFDYMSLQVGATFNFGPSGSEYIVYGVGQPFSPTSSLPSAPGAALNLLLTIGTGNF
jgi:hypothetical protein